MFTWFTLMELEWSMVTSICKCKKDVTNTLQLRLFCTKSSILCVPFSHIRLKQVNICASFLQMHLLLGMLRVMGAMGKLLAIGFQFHSYAPNAAYMRQWIGSALIQVMTCRLFVAKPSHYLNHCCLIVKWTLRNKLQWNSNGNMKLSVH